MKILYAFLILVLFASFTQAQENKYEVFFLKNETTINDKIKSTLDETVLVLNQKKQFIVDIKTDNENSIDIDIQKKREMSITNYLVEQNIDLYRIMSKIKIESGQNNIIQIVVNETTPDIVASNETNESKLQENNSKVTTVNSGDVVITNMLFDFDKDITEEYYTNLDKLANYLKSNTKVKIEIQGYSDLQGDASYNLDLSYRRADFAKQYLTEKGCDKNNIKVKTLGEKNQISIDISPESRKYNRRVEFIVLNQGENKLIVKSIEVPSEYKL